MNKQIESGRKEFWSSQSNDMLGMMGNSSAAQNAEEDTNEILDIIPDYENKRVLELAGGNGRFTAYLAEKASAVTTVDLVRDFVFENRRINENYRNITYITSSATDVDFADDSFDFLFIHWLLMNIENEEVEQIVPLLANWTADNGQLFLRESCNTASNPSISKPFSNYREPRYYEELFSPYFTLEKMGNVKTYERLYDNSNQIWWIFKKR